MRYLLNVIVLLVLYSICAESFGQNTKITGNIISQEDSQPIPFASIRLAPQYNKGTISNIKGEFNLEAEPKTIDTIIISCVGFQTKKILQSNIRNYMTISLKPKIYELREVVIINSEAKKLIMKAYSNVQKNYPSTYPTLHGIYRKQMIENNHYAFFGECNMNVRIPTQSQYQQNILPLISFENIRVSENKVTYENPIHLLANSILIPYPIFYYFRDKYIDDFLWEIEDIVSLDNKEYVYIISFKGKVLAKDPLNQYNSGYVYISGSDYSILSVRRKEIKQLRSKNGEKKPKNINLITNYTYERSGGHYVLKYARAEASFDIVDSNKKKNNYIVVTDYYSQYNEYSNKSKNFIESRIDPFNNLTGIVPLQWNSFKTILPDYERLLDENVTKKGIKPTGRQ